MPFKTRAVTESDIEEARKSARKIVAMAREGVMPNQIGAALKIPTGAIKKILEEPLPPLDSAPETPPTAPASLPQEPYYQTEPAPTAPPNREPPPEWSHPVPPRWAQPVQSPAPEPSPAMVGAYETGSTTDIVFQLAVDAMIPTPKARGIARRFDHYRADDYGALAKILSTAGVSVPAQRTVLEGYKEMTGPVDSGSDPLSALGGDSMNPLSGLDLENDRAWVRDMRRRAIEADIRLRERRAAGLDNPGSPTTGTSSADTETTRLLREQIAQRDRELAQKDREFLELRHTNEMNALRTDLTRQIDDVKRGTAAPTAQEIEATARADMTKTLTREVSSRSGDAGVLVKTIRQKTATDPALQRRVLRAVDEFLPADPATDGTMGDGHVQPSEDDLEELTRQLHKQAAGPPAEMNLTAEAPRSIRRIETPVEQPASADSPDVGFQSG